MVYKERDRLLDGSRDLEHILEDILADYTKQISEKTYSSPRELFHFIVTNISFGMRELPADLDLADADQIRELLEEIIVKEIAAKKEDLQPHQLYDSFLRISMLKAIDDNWVEQVDYLQQLSLAIGSQSASQKNPIVEYYQEAYAGFETMKQQIRTDMVRNLLMGIVEVTPKGEILTHFP